MLTSATVSYTHLHALGLEVLLEIHTFSELAYVNADVDMVGVNNRNLGTFVTLSLIHILAANN